MQQDEYKMVNTKTVRDSGIELCRIIAMLLVMILHASFKSLSIPTQIEIETDLLSSFYRFHSESLAIICVNVFILISGWFGIRPKTKRFFSLVFQIWFWFFLMAIATNALSISNLSMRGNNWVGGLLFTNDWFIKSYITLFILSPILNAWCERASKKEFEILLAAFFILQTLYGFITNSNWYNSGFSPLSFAGLYLLARYLKLHPTKLSSMNKITDISLYFVLTLSITIVTMALIARGYDVNKRFYAYSNPIVIVSSVFFFLFFTKIHLKSRVINWIAASSFSAYLLHFNINFRQYYFNTINDLYNNEGRLFFVLYTIGFILLLFIAAIIIDKCRLFIWNKIQNCIWR